jgi:hypothetical protein
MAKLRYKNVCILIVTLLMMLGNAVPVIASDEASPLVAGQVVFAVGDAYVVSLSGPQKATVGSIVLAGDRLVTGVNGYVHLRMADGAFLGVRSDSLLEVNEYMFDMTKPENGRVRLFLKEGTVRAISGRIADENKQNFRLNTPLAAIGVRGTDFVAAADQGSTKVAVTSGGISMSPYGERCVVVELGSCLGDHVIDLNAKRANSFLVVRQGQAAVQVLNGDIETLFAPAHPQEKYDTNINLSHLDDGSLNDDTSHVLTFESQKKMSEQEIKALNLLPSVVAQELLQIDTLELVRLSSAVGVQQAYRQKLDRKVVNIADGLFNIVAQSQPLMRFYDQTGMLAWSDSEDAAMFDERIIAMQKGQTYEALMAQIGVGAYLQGFGMKAAQADAAIGAWSDYYIGSLQEPIAQLGTSNLYHPEGLKTLATLPLNSYFPQMNVTYESHDANIISSSDGMVIEDVVFKINHNNGVFEAKIKVSDMVNGQQDYAVTGSLNMSGMVFGANESAALEGLIINATGQIATIFNYNNGSAQGDALLLFDDTALFWDEVRLEASPALYKADGNALINWGRWEHYAPLDDKVIERLHLANLDLVAKNSYFALFQPITAAHAMPIGDSFNFGLGSYEALHVTEGGTTTATLTDAKLNVNFSTAQFSTQMDVTAPRLLAPIHLFAQGEVGVLGQLFSSALGSNINVAGAVADNGSSVGLLLEHLINDTSSVVAATEWMPE